MTDLYKITNHLGKDIYVAAWDKHEAYGLYYVESLCDNPDIEKPNPYLGYFISKIDLEQTQIHDHLYALLLEGRSGRLVRGSFTMPQFWYECFPSELQESGWMWDEAYFIVTEEDNWGPFANLQTAIFWATYKEVLHECKFELRNLIDL